MEIISSRSQTVKWWQDIDEYFHKQIKTSRKLKGHSQLWDRAGLDTSFVTFEKRLPQPEIKVTRRRHLQNPLQSCFVVLLSLIFYSRPVPEYSFSHLSKLFYRIWLKRIESSVQWNMDRRGGKREGAGRKKSPALTKITRKINQKHWRANHHSIYLENRVFSSWRKIKQRTTISLFCISGCLCRPEALWLGLDVGGPRFFDFGRFASQRRFAFPGQVHR